MSNEEFDDRVVAHLYHENHGPSYNRISWIKELCLEAKIRATEKPFEICTFKNDYGWCKLEVGHSGSHTVIFLGKD